MHPFYEIDLSFPQKGRIEIFEAIFGRLGKNALLCHGGLAVEIKMKEISDKILIINKICGGGGKHFKPFEIERKSRRVYAVCRGLFGKFF